MLNSYLSGIRNSIFPAVVVCLIFGAIASVSSLHASPATSQVAANIEKARELVLKGDRATASQILRDQYREFVKEPSAPGASDAGLSKIKTSKADRELAREIAQAWREIVEVFLTDRGQNQYSLADSFWLTKPKEAADLLVPVLKSENGNLAVSRLGVRASLRALDCLKAETFQQQAELIFPIGADTRLLRLQIQDCTNGTNATAPALKIPPDTDWTEFEGAIHLLTVKDAFRRNDLKASRAALAVWEAQGATNPEFWYWKWKASADSLRDRTAARKYLRLCGDLTPRRRKTFAMYPELCLHTETVESNLKSSDKAGL